MKAKLLIVAVLVILLQLSCETEKRQESVLEYDQITYREINKMLVGISKDSINMGCYPTIIEIKYNANPTPSDSVEAFIKYPEQTIDSCWIGYFVDDSGERIRCLPEHNIISQYSQWNQHQHPHSALSLTDFKGKGEKYIGFRISCPPYPYLNEITHYCYGWIKVELNASKDSLKIIDMAINETKTRSILAGHTE